MPPAGRGRGEELRVGLPERGGGAEPYTHSRITRCQFAVASSWPSAASVIACMRFENSEFAGMVSLRIRSQYSERGSPASTISRDTYRDVSVTGSSVAYQEFSART